METENLKKEFEAKLAEMKASYEAELMSKKKLQEEMERLRNDYNRKVHDVEEQFSRETTMEGTGAVLADSAISMIALANDVVSEKLCLHKRQKILVSDFSKIKLCSTLQFFSISLAFTCIICLPPIDVVYSK